MKALEGLRVVDLTTLLSGPYGTLLLADLGAEVIKVEQPGGGDPSRTLQESDPNYHYAGMSSYFLTLGRNKRSVVLDLRNPKGREVLHDLVRVSDVVTDNFRPGVLERLGADYPTLRAVNPRIISCSITGYGLTGPGKDRAAFDACIQAYAGGMSITGGPNDSPVRAGIPYGDLCSGAYAALGILAALAARERTGEGQQVDISMMDVQLSLWNYMATMYFMSGIPTPKLGNEHFAHVPYNAFQTKDLYLFLAIIPDPHWPKFLEVVERAGLDDSFADDIQVLKEDRLRTRAGRVASRDRINAAIGHVMRARTCDEWATDLLANGVPCAPVNTVDRAFTDPQTLARHMVVEVPHHAGHTFKQPGNPIKLSATGDDTYSAPPPVGQHTAEVLRDLLHYDPGQIETLAKEGAMGSPASQDG